MKRRRHSRSPDARPPALARRRWRRGSIYAVVLGLASLVTAVVVGTLAAARFTARAATASDDWNEAGLMAFSACEQAIAKVNVDAAASPYAWRANYTSGQVAATVTLGRGTYQWVLTDPADGNLANDYSQSITLYGIGKVGRATRVYSVTLLAGGLGVDVLRSAYHADSQILLNGLSVVSAGPASSAGKLRGNGTLSGNLDANGKTGGVTLTGTNTILGYPKVLPSTNVFATYKAKATALPSSAVSAGNFSPGSLTPTNNPSGAADPDGLYYLPLPSNSVVTINPMRLLGTLLIEGNPAASPQTVTITGAQAWAPQRADYPVLIVKGVDTVRLGGSTSTLTVGGTTYPSEFRGLIHCIGTTSVELNDACSVFGCLIAEGAVTANGTSAVTWDAKLYNAPPSGYQRGDVLTPAPGTWKWDQWP